MLSSTRFFKTKVPVIKKETGAAKQVMDGGMDSLRAVAIACIDNFTNEIFPSKEAVEKILTKFFSHYEHYKISQTSPLERLRILLNSLSQSDLVISLSYVLRQITIDELLAKPLAYKESFLAFSSDTPQAQLRNDSTPLPSSSLLALANALQIEINLSFRDNEKKIRALKTYPSERSSSFRVDLDVRDGEYFPAVKNANGMKVYLGRSALKAAEPKIIVESETIAPQVEQIEVDNQKIWREYKQDLSHVEGLILDKKLTTANLIALYVKFLPSSTEMALFNGLEKKYGAVQAKTIPISDENMQMMVKGLARGLSSNHIDVDEFFKTFDEPAQRHSAVPAA